MRLEGKVIEIGNREKCAVKLKKTIKKVWDKLNISLSLKLIITLSRKIQLIPLLRAQAYTPRLYVKLKKAVMNVQSKHIPS